MSFDEAVAACVLKYRMHIDDEIYKITGFCTVMLYINKQQEQN